MDEFCRLSVVIPGFKTPESWWRRCVQSVLASTTEQDEIICVDDGSPTKPLFLDDMAKVHSRVRVIYLGENQGQAEARNLGVEAARGKYIAFVDSDDEVCPEAYDSAIRMVENDLCDMAIFGVRTIWPAERLQKIDVMPNANYGRIKPSDLKKLKDNGLLYYPWNKVFKRTFLESHAIRFDKFGMPCEDIMLNLSCVMAGARVCVTDNVGINYYRTWGTSLSSYKPECITGLKMCNALWERYKHNDPDAEVVFGIGPEFSENFLLRREWNNMWMNNSPCTLKEKKDFLMKHPSLSSLHWLIFLVLQIIYWGLRKHLYIAVIRKWHIRRLYKDAMEF